MRCWLALACCLSLAGADVAHLRELERNGRIFELREALGQAGGDDSQTLFYRAIVECRFGHEAEGVEDLRKFLMTPADRQIERKAYEELASALLRMGRYGDSAAALDQALRVTPKRDVDRADNENSRALYESLKDVPAQAVRFNGDVAIEAKHNPIGSWDVPVEVNGVRGEWIFDTGANFSTLTESEAARMGLAIRESRTYVKGSTGKKNSLRLAVARDLRLGGADVSNVVFLVLPDQSLYIGPMKYGIRGILGIPAIRALGRVEMSAEGKVRIEAESGDATGVANMFFADQDPMVVARHSDHLMQMFLDTGANATSAYPSFRSALSKDELGGLKRKKESTGGAGGTVTQTISVIPELRLEMPGRQLDLRNLSLLPKQLEGDKRFRDGVLGVDALTGGFTLDFRRMQFKVD